ncbi:uncharacterized protein CDAR_413241 [Caerostris darwini]|uniref:Reverse transcriptase domain-containing protein n=1 Tax=Caerostris darwini TaxID=1538125 RepID=A0AAV4X0I0_9ARAC|nr:uncharacterized protein CDAR_413241 [Caerostris darwini]
MTRVLFGVNSSPFLLGAVIRHHIRKFEIQYPETSSMISTSMYVDDLLLGSLTVENTLNLAKKSSDIFLKANMLLRKWQSNSLELREHLRSLKFDICETVPRCYFRDFQGNYDSIEIHCFCDASEKAFGSVIFLRFTKDEKVRTAFVTSKSRLAPIKRMTLPRLELMGAVVGARLIYRVLIGGIVEGETILLIVTRGITIKDLENDELWWFGPSWLIKNYGVWPKEKEIKVTVDKGLLKEERKANVVPQNLCTLDSRELLIDANRFSSLLKIIRIISWIRRFICNLRNPDKRVRNLSAEEIKESEFFLIKEVQLRSYEEEIQSLKGNRQIKKTSKIYNLCPYLDDINLLRIDSRLHQGEFSLNETNPILLPKKR